MRNKKKYVMFDIDGTLIRPLAPEFAMGRFPYAIKKVFNKDINLDSSMWSKRFNGVGDREIFLGLLEGSGVSQEFLVSKLDSLGDAFDEYLTNASKERALYARIDHAHQLFMKVHNSRHHVLGTLTGNLGKSALWKLSHVGISTDQFCVSVFGHEADMRDDLAKLVIPKIETLYGETPDPRDIIFIGDTKHDIICARKIGARVIIVTTGWNIDKGELQRMKPDLLVDSLMDERVLQLLELKT
ncbi:MAG: HAD hydrolase-like protein [Patescibacteria group bacterium]